MKIFNMTKKKGSFGYASCKDMAAAMNNNIDQASNDAIDAIELSMLGKGDESKAGFFLNIKLKDSYIENLVNNISYCKGPVTMADDAGEEA
jgi:hypothetical protein